MPETIYHWSTGSGLNLARVEEREGGGPGRLIVYHFVGGRGWCMVNGKCGRKMRGAEGNGRLRLNVLWTIPLANPVPNAYVLLVASSAYARSPTTRILCRPTPLQGTYSGSGTKPVR